MTAQKTTNPPLHINSIAVPLDNSYTYMTDTLKSAKTLLYGKPCVVKSLPYNMLTMTSNGYQNLEFITVEYQRELYSILNDVLSEEAWINRAIQRVGTFFPIDYNDYIDRRR